MNQRYRNDDDFGRRTSEDELEYRYAQPNADSRFERDRNPRYQSRYRDESQHGDGDRSIGFHNQGMPDYSSRNSGQSYGSSDYRGAGNFGAGSQRSNDSWRGISEDQWRSRGYGQESREPFGVRGRDDSFRGDPERQGSASRFSAAQDYGSGYRDYGSNRDYSRPGPGVFGDDNHYAANTRSFDGRSAGQFGNRSLGDNGRQAAAFYSDSGQRRGEHFGKGPKGYQRSDERIREDVCDRLAQDDALDARNITVTTNKGEVTLEGSVPDRFSKHRAEDIVDSISGVTDINNRLKVDKGFFDDIADRLTGNNQNHSGHAGERPTENKNGHSALTR